MWKRDISFYFPWRPLTNLSFPDSEQTLLQSYLKHGLFSLPCNFFAGQSLASTGWGGQKQQENWSGKEKNGMEEGDTIS